MKQAEQLKLSGQLPSPRGVALAILELSRRENATLGEIARVVQTDPALSGRLIKLANAATSIARPVVSVQEAVARQGMLTVRQLALGFSLLDQYRNGACKGFDYQRYWSHSLLMALTMQALGQRVHVAAADELFVCGLLAQVGRLALATAYPEPYDAVLAAHRTDPGQPLAAHERARLETDHCELGHVMLTDWGLPRVFADPLAHYEEADHPGYPQDSRTHSLFVMLRLAHNLADLGLAEPDERARRVGEWMAQAADLDFSDATAGPFIDEVVAAWREWGKLLHVPVTALPSFAEMQPSPPAAAPPARAPLRIIVADGNAFTRRKTVAMLVEDSSHVVYPADNGDTALALALEVCPHVIVSTFELPGLDGIELCLALRATDEGRRIHIILMDEGQSEEQLTRAYEAGADGYAPLAISPKGLHTRLRAAQRLVQLQDGGEKDRAQLRQIAAELAVANRRLANAALTDLLTGLPNRRAAMDLLQQIWSAANRSGRPFAVLVLDVDHFKNINDSYGHAAGDLVLREVSTMLRNAARREDSVCRIGGEEFLVICPNTELQLARVVAERLRDALASRPIAIGKTLRTITISIGIAEREADMPEPDALIGTADRALYQAKSAGRNRICIGQYTCQVAPAQDTTTLS